MSERSQPPISDAYTQVDTFIGSTRARYYTAAFRRIGAKSGFVLTLNWWAALLGPFWWAARQMWGMTIIFWVLELNLIAQLFHGLFGNLGGEQAARAERLLARSAARAEEAKAALAAGDENAERIASSAENLAKVAAEASAEAVRLNAEAPVIVATSLTLLLAVKAVQLVTANWMLERKYMVWRARRSTDARPSMPGAVIAWCMIATTIFVTVILRVVDTAPAWLGAFPADPEWRNQVASIIDGAFDWATSTGGVFFGAITLSIEALVSLLERMLLGTPWPVVLALVTTLAWRAAGARTAIFVAAAMCYLGLLGFWEPSLSTLALLGAAAFVAIALGIPIGIWCARSSRAYAVIRPVLDFMQTMPAFVYLIPVIALFGIGKPPAVIATLSFGMPPVIRLTTLGLRGVPADVREAAFAFGATPLMVLWKVDLPMAAPSILTGINQTILMSLGMVVIASLIGAEGLGQDVLQALQFAATGYGMLAGLAILFCAMILDRIVQGRSRAAG